MLFHGFHVILNVPSLTLCPEGGRFGYLRQGRHACVVDGTSSERIWNASDRWDHPPDFRMDASLLR